MGRVGGPGAQQDQNAQNKNTEGPHRSKSSSILTNPRPSEFSINEDIFGFDKVTIICLYHISNYRIYRYAIVAQESE